MTNYILVTGGASGIGLAITTHLANNGYKVFCTDINKYSGEPSENIIPLIMDVTKPASVEAAFKVISQQTDTLKCVINNAGIFVMEAICEIDEAKLQNIIDINLMGMYRVNKIFLPLLKGDYSRIINISSEIAQYSSPPFNGPYVISKVAVEAYSDALRRELKLLKIPVVKIRPGSLKTNMLTETTKSCNHLMETTKYFKDSFGNMVSMMSHELNKTNDPMLLAKLTQKIIEKKKPKIMYRIVNSKQLKFLGILPEKTQDWLFHMILTSKKK
ncbi:MAG: SDR family NAD(P)-dependent oxidoreductase [Firmicutes bacterium]|nr:SDR family NAD(P)-dependent oxidoreductase [Bacillota bacterium]